MYLMYILYLVCVCIIFLAYKSIAVNFSFCSNDAVFLCYDIFKVTGKNIFECWLLSELILGYFQVCQQFSIYSVLYIIIIFGTLSSIGSLFQCHCFSLSCAFCFMMEYFLVEFSFSSSYLPSSILILGLCGFFSSIFLSIAPLRIVQFLCLHPIVLIEHLFSSTRLRTSLFNFFVQPS